MSDQGWLPTDPGAPVIAAAPRVRPGMLLAGRWEVGAPLGRGGMATVYRAFDRELAEPVALKVFALDHTDPAAIERVRAEVRLARRIAHPAVCRVHDLGEADGVRFLTMELIDGAPLRATLAGDPLPIGRRLELIGQIVGGVAAAHVAGVVHADLKPENILVRRTGQAVVADFGLAHELGAGGGRELGGTRWYLPPERLAGAPPDARGDVYALGLVVAELLGGIEPAPGVADRDVPSMVAAAVPAALARTLAADDAAALTPIVLRAIAIEPGERFADAPALAVALERAVGKKRMTAPPLVRPRWRVPARSPRLTLVAAVAVGLSVAIAIVAWLAHRRASTSPAELDGFVRSVAEQRARAWRDHRRTAADLRLRALHARPGRLQDLDERGARLAEVEAIRAIDPDSVPAAVTHAELLLYEADASRDRAILARALATIDDAAVRAPTDVPAAVLRCRLRQYAAEFTGDPRDVELEAAADACRAALALAPDAGRVRLALANLHDRGCRDEDALRALEEAVKLEREPARRLRPLQQLVELSLFTDRVELADAYSRELVDAAARAATRPEAPAAAAVIRAGVLFRLDRRVEGKAALTAAVEAARRQLLPVEVEAAALRGLARAGVALSRAQRTRLERIEADTTGDERVQALARQYFWIDPPAFAAWMTRLSPASSCRDAIPRAYLYRADGDHAAIEAALASCVPDQRWMQACVAVLTGR